MEGISSFHSGPPEVTKICRGEPMSDNPGGRQLTEKLPMLKQMCPHDSSGKIPLFTQAITKT